MLFRLERKYRSAEKTEWETKKNIEPDVWFDGNGDVNDGIENDNGHKYE